MELRHLTYFLAVVDQKGFSAAARSIPVSQPAVSQAVRELERELGTELFTRLGRRVVLTPAGEALCGPARRALREVIAGREAVASVAGLHSGTLSVCCLPTLAAHPLATMAAAYRRLYPGVVLQLSGPESAAELVSLLREGQCELGVCERVPGAPDLDQLDLVDQDLLLVMAPGSPPPDGPVPLRELSSTPMIAMPGGTSTRRLMEEWFAESDGPPSVVVETSLRDAVLPLVLGGAGAALLPRPMAEIAGRLGAVVAWPAPPVRRQVVLVRRRGPLAPAAERFWELAGPVRTSSEAPTNADRMAATTGG